MKILLHHPNGSDGTSFYRGFGPFNAMARKEPEITIVNGNTEISWEFLTQFDLVFIQRPASKWHTDLVKMCKEYGVPVWVDWDDHYFEIPDSNPRKKFYSDYHIEQVRWVAKNADFITVSTSYLFKEFSPYNKNIKIVSNALDTRFFDPEAYLEYPREKVILWRGSDTHAEDLDHYREQILPLMAETQDYVWAFFGYHPQWAIDFLPADRIRLYDYTGPIEFIQGMFAIRPTLVYVPMLDTPFNRSRSNCAWIEATYAGAAVVAPGWDEWNHIPCAKYFEQLSGKEDFSNAFRTALKTSQDLVQRSSALLYRDYKLNSVNDVRFQILHSLVGKSPVTSRRNLLPPVDPQPFTDKEFFDYNRENGWCQDNPEWIKGQEQFADYLINQLRGQVFMDIGCGPGALVETLLKRDKVVAYGIDTNPLNYEYFVQRNPQWKENFICDSAHQVLPGNVFDVVTCVEVFEHLTDEVCEAILMNWKGRCKFFLFTSTPYHSTPHFDKQWGHINVKPTEHWKAFFEDKGFTFIQELDYPTKWALLFVSK
jgi:2-polyprenyl-3-methyl-5-hydroxy-6-metoxy-1,4-benzoquinol methylase